MTAAAAAAACLAGLALLVSGRILGGPDGWWWRSTALATAAWTAGAVAALAACAGDSGWWSWAATAVVLAVAAVAARMTAHQQWHTELDGGADDEESEARDMTTRVHVSALWGGPQRWLANRGPRNGHRGRAGTARPQ